MRARLFQTVTAIVSLATSGCLMIGGGWGGPTVWVDSTETLPIDSTGMESLVVRTHNGAVTFAGQAEGWTGSSVTVTRKGGGPSLIQAEEALAAIDVFVESVGGGTTKIGWRWNGPKHRNWRASVSFDIKAPGQLNFDGETHNGGIRVVGVTGDVLTVTHNGAVEVDSRGGKLEAGTHNGQVTVAYAGDEIKLITHNGGVQADLGQCSSIRGSITTHNGGVTVGMGENTSARLRCKTHNGRVSSKVPLVEAEISRTKLIGTIGHGGSDLNITTHNGGIQIKKSEG